MSVKSAGWSHCLDVLCHAPRDSFDWRLGADLSEANTDDQALDVLIPIVTEDPAGSHEYVVAGHMLRHLTEEVAR